MKKIIAPVDFSEHTDIICNYILEYARHLPSEILLFHTYYDQIVIADSSFPDTIEVNTMYNEELMKEIQHLAEKKIKELESGLLKRIDDEKIKDVTVRSEVRGGAINSELLEICHEYHPDLVVIGSKGEGKNINQWGKISTYLVNHLTEPILILPQIKKFLGFENIMVGIDLDHYNAKMISRLLSLFDNLPGKLFCVHFLVSKKTPEEINRFKAIKEQVDKMTASRAIKFEMIGTDDDNQKAIDDYIKDHDIRLIAFQPHKHSIFYKLFTSNITRKNLFATNIPLLAIPGE
jgi:nucleotide-binding universal stress UspA family protein